MLCITKWEVTTEWKKVNVVSVHKKQQVNIKELHTNFAASNMCLFIWKNTWVPKTNRLILENQLSFTLGEIYDSSDYAFEVRGVFLIYQSF